jgi:hypothetical protein
MKQVSPRSPIYDNCSVITVDLDNEPKMFDFVKCLLTSMRPVDRVDDWIYITISEDDVKNFNVYRKEIYVK